MAVKQYTIAVRDSANGNSPKTGLTPAWNFLVKTSDYVTTPPFPTITETVPLVAPAAPTQGTPTAGGAVDAGTHVYATTLLNSGGETTPSVNSNSQTIVGGSQTVPITAIATGAAGSGTTGRKVYRSKAGTTTPLYLLTTINDNTTTTFSDTTADASLGAQPPAANTTGRGQYHFPYDAAINGEAVGQIDCGSALSNAGDRYLDVMLVV